MSTADRPIEDIISALTEQSKELACLSEVDDILCEYDTNPECNPYPELLKAIPNGWKYPRICRAKITLAESVHKPVDFVETPWFMTADITFQGEVIGEVAVYYSEKKPRADEGPFLETERRLLNAIAERVGFSVLLRRVRGARARIESVRESITARDRHASGIVTEFLRSTDPGLLLRLTRKMINQLCWSGIEEANELLQKSFHEDQLFDMDTFDENRPLRTRNPAETPRLIQTTFDIAARHLSEREILAHLQDWINEEKSTFLIKSLENPGTGLTEIAEALERYQAAGVEESQLSQAVQTSLKVALLRRFFVDQLDFINIAKNYVAIDDFYDLIQRLVYPAKSQGKLGGKGGGLFLAMQAIQTFDDDPDFFANLRTPKTWYVVSDALPEFMHHNNLEEVYNRKYMEIDRIRQDYPHIIQVFKNSQFPLSTSKALSACLDDFGDSPLIVRSSSLLEDQVGSAFSGKYKSLFLANQGPKRERLAALQDAIAEVYASVFGPDPIEYRAERGLLDFREEMGILIQEVVGKRVGKYFFPAFAGVAFSNNEFRWSPRIKREDGLVRLVPGLGTRAVDRLTDDYPVLVTPGQPGLRANINCEEVIRYSPRMADVINIEENAFETVDIQELMRECGDDYPAVRRIISIVENNRIRQPSVLEPDWQRDDFVVTFEGLITQTPFVKQMRTLLRLLREKLGMPVDIEFASDGENFYLVQCRAQSYSKNQEPDSIPRELPRDKLLFTANRFISNGRVPDISHIVYVDPDQYNQIGSHQQLREIGHVVGRLNKILPKRRFILMGPGRWGSRGDIKLGVSVTYSDINNTAMLIEIARQKGNYVPELSFGTHFFQDLVEAEIRYLPLYPDDDGIVFNEPYLRRARNILPDLLPAAAPLADTVKVIDVSAESSGLMLRVLMNAEIDQAVGLLAPPQGSSTNGSVQLTSAVGSTPDDHWKWRRRMAEQIAERIDAKRYGVKAMYIAGSAKTETASGESDIDLILHVDDNEVLRSELRLWLDGWSQSLAEVNFLRTGYRADGLLDVYYVTDEDIEDGRGQAAKINANVDAAQPLILKRL